MTLGLTRGEFLALPLAARIQCAAAQFLGWRYSLLSPRVPFAAGSLPPSLVGGKRVTNCSTMTAAILMAVYDKEWDHEDYEHLQCFPKWLEVYPMGDSPLYACIDHEIGQRVYQFAPHHWHVVQVWRSVVDGAVMAGGGGHSMLAYFDGGTCWTIEASGNRSGGVGAKLSAKDPSAFTNYAVCHMLRLRP